MRFVILSLALALNCIGQEFNGLGDLAVGRVAAAAGYTYTATKFDGANDYLFHDGDLTGSVDSKVGTLSLWFKLNDAAQDATAREIVQLVGDRFDVLITTDNQFRIDGQDASFNTALVLRSTTTFTASATWHHILASWDCAASANTVYIDGVLETLAGNTMGNFNVDYAHGGSGSGWDWGIAAKANGTLKDSVSLSELWFDPTAMMDFSVSGNRAKFRSAGGKPVSLGGDGSTPTGTAPLIYLRNSNATFQNNLGTGGNFTANGAPSNDASIP